MIPQKHGVYSDKLLIFVNLLFLHRYQLILEIVVYFKKIVVFQNLFMAQFLFLPPEGFIFWEFSRSTLGTSFKIKEHALILFVFNLNRILHHNDIN